MSSGLTNSDLAAKAESLHNAGAYDEALACLHSIQANIADKQDPRLLHNLRLVENAQKVAKGFNNIQPLLDGLLAIKQQLRAKHERDNNVEPSTSDDSTEADDSVDALLSDADTSILLYNLAALHFQRKEYATSRNILEKLFAHIEPIDEGVAVHICFLLLDVLLHMHRGTLLSDKDRGTFAHSADQVLTHLSKVHMTSSSNVDGTGDQANGGQGSGTTNEGKNEKKDATPEQVEYEFRLRLYRAKVSLLQHQLKLSKKEIKSALEVYQRDLRSQVPGDASDPFRRNEQLDGIDPSISRIGMRNSTAIYVKANFEYLRQNYRKALKLLASSHGGNVGDPSDAAASMSISKQQVTHSTAKPAGPVGCMYYNNVGCVHHKMRRHQIALYYFQKALVLATDTNARVLHPDGRVMPTLDCEIRYNLALQLLITGRPRDAFSRFKEAAALFYKRPNLWLRMAECCMQYHASQEKEQTGDKSESSVSNGGVVATLVGEGQQRRLLLPCSRPDSCDGPTKHTGASAEDALNGSCTMLYASTCLQNVVYLSTAATLLTDSRKEDGKGIFGAAVQPGSKESKRKDTGTNDSGYDVEPTGDMIRGLAAADDSPVLQAAYLDLAYVHLTLADPVIALSYLGKLLALPSLASACKFLGHMYAAEALCLLGKPNEALDHVAPTQVPKSNNPQGTAGNNFSGSSSWQTNNPQTSGGSASETVSTTGPFSAAEVAALHVNMATVYALQGQLHLADKATRKAVEVCPWSWAAARMLVYILLRTGCIAEALKTLKLSRVNSMAAGNHTGNQQTS